MRQQDPFGEEKTRLPAVELKSSLPSTASVTTGMCVCFCFSSHSALGRLCGSGFCGEYHSPMLLYFQKVLFRAL